VTCDGMSVMYASGSACIIDCMRSVVEHFWELVLRRTSRKSELGTRRDLLAFFIWVPCRRDHKFSGADG